MVCVSSCFRVEDIDEYMNPSSSVYKNCPCIRCLAHNFLNLYISLFRRGETRSLPSSVQATASITSSSSHDNFLSEAFRSAPRPLPYDADPRYFRSLVSRREKGSSHSHVEAEPLRGDSDADAVGGGCKWANSKSDKDSKEEYSTKSGLRSSKSKSIMVDFEGMYILSEDEDVCPTCLEVLAPPKLLYWVSENRKIVWRRQRRIADSLQQRVELLETKSDDANLISVKETVEGLDASLIYVAEVVHVRLLLDHEGKHVGCGYVEFASANEAKKALEKKNREYLHYEKIILDETSYFVEELALPKKTLFVSNLPRQISPQTQISDIINFFKDVGKVVRVRVVVTPSRRHYRGLGFVEFASANETNKALQKKNSEYLHDHKIFLDVAYRGTTYLPPPKYCIDHKVWYEEDYLQRESLPIEEDATVEGLDKTPNFASINFFEDVGDVVSVRLIVNHEGKHVGYGFVQFASAYQAKKVLEEKNGEYLHDHKILLMKGLDKTPDFDQAVATVRNKTLFVANLSNQQIQISDIINFFKDVGEVVHVRLVVDQWGRLRGNGFVRFASADEANKALEKKNGEYLHNCEIILGVADRGASEYLEEGTMYCIDHKVWYEESFLIEEDAAAVEGLDETPDFAEEVVVRKKTVFAFSHHNRINDDIVNILKDAVCIRRIVDHWGELVGCFFVEFASANEAKKAVQEQNGDKFFLRMAERDHPYPFRPKYNLEERLWYEDNLVRKILCEKSKWNKSKRNIFSDDE